MKEDIDKQLDTAIALDDYRDDKKKRCVGIDGSVVWMTDAEREADDRKSMKDLRTVFGPPEDCGGPVYLGDGIYIQEDGELTDYDWK